MTEINLGEQEASDAHPKAIQHINFTTNLDHAGEAFMYFIY